MRCQFDLCWIGQCKAAACEGAEMCAKHAGEVCSCGKPARGQCGYAGMLVCGLPLCDDCRCKWHGDKRHKFHHVEVDEDEA